MYGKLIGGELKIAPKKLNRNDVVVYNPVEYMYREQGWKPVVFVVSPKAPTGYYYEPGWKEQTDTITQTWKLTPSPDDIDETEAWNIIFGGIE